MGPLNVKCQLIWAGHEHLSAMGTNYRKSRRQTAQFLAYTTFLVTAEASIKKDTKVVILSRKLFSSVKYNAHLVQFFILNPEQNSLTSPIDFLSYIFSVSENTKIIHLIMMIWLLSFIISSYKLASSPPKDPGGSKKILSKSRI